MGLNVCYRKELTSVVHPAMSANVLWPLAAMLLPTSNFRFGLRSGHGANELFQNIIPKNFLRKFRDKDN